MTHTAPVANNSDARLWAKLAAIEARLKVLEKLPINIQTGKTVVAVAAGANTFELTLPHEWATEQQAFLISLRPVTENGTWVTNSGPYAGTGLPSKSKGYFVIEAPATTQNVEVWWTSIGR